MESMVLFNPRTTATPYPDARTSDVMRLLVEFFETKGLARIKEDDHGAVWYQDFLDFVAEHRLFATMCTPAAYGGDDTRWDTWRNCEFGEILGFYGLPYWYTWQVSVLGLGPIWMSDNEDIKQRTADLLDAGAVFAFGLSEKEHGADLYSSEVRLEPHGDGTYLASGRKYYIGNGNAAAIVSTFGTIPDSGEYAFFAVYPDRPGYTCVQNVVHSQNYVAEFELDGYVVRDEDILSRGDAAWDTALNTVNVGKFNLGWASIGIATHAFYEAVAHAANRVLYGMRVTDFPHVQALLTDAYARLVAMKLVAQRSSDYMRSASAEDRRYLLYNPVVKMKVTTQGEDVINHLWDVIAAKGFEKDMYFEMAARDIRALPKLEGTVHVNIALIVKFMENYLFHPAELEAIPRRDDAADDAFLWDQGPTRGLSKIRFHDADQVFSRFDLPNVAVFREQVAALKTMLVAATPTEDQTRDIDFLLALGEIFTLVVYGQLFLESVEISGLDHGLVDHVFDVLVRDWSRFAAVLHGKPTTSKEQAEHCISMIRRPVVDRDRFARVWQTVLGHQDAYRMNP
jgi:acyl-CoA dehydrogenase